ncbi:hypothetical protein [Chryseobacterium limigenitum]|uniref:Uncharacterized protein n=1 Tax=Chryseobacterium limigenitum TaxID=1612149 RepID=A0A1K2IH97_9FLAO|nr:hypothetical protein [Chryseobacterium limigenitum]SFZ91043.1 hypothetical protein SAMN05216324_10219 [Chryseobacterium limigenitum]
MKLNLIINNNENFEIQWDFPLIPEIGHKLYLIDFIGEEAFEKGNYKDDYFVVTDIIWMKTKSDPSINLMLEEQ